MTGPLRESFNAILERYVRARTGEVFGRAHPLWAEFDSVAEQLRTSEVVARAQDYSVKWSAGQGNWATVPWVAILSARETTRIRTGVYVVYLVKADASGVYLTLNQGTAGVAIGSPRQKASALRDNARRLQRACVDLNTSGFSLDHEIALATTLPSVRVYEDSTIAYKLYRRGELPSDVRLFDDLRVACDAYERIIPSRRLLEPGGTSATGSADE